MELDEIYEIYKLPKIKREKLTDIEYQHRTKYLKLYIRLIERCKTMTEEETSGYCEVHHILPRTMKGKDIKENLVNMPIRYHIMAHIVIVEAYPNHGGLRRALLFMTNNGDKNNQIYRKEGIKTFSTRFLAELRLKANEKLNEVGRISEEGKKRISIANSRKLSEETKRKMSQSRKGKKPSPEQIRKAIETKKKNGFHHTEETKKRISEKNKGFKHTEEAKKKIAEASRNRIVSEETRHKLSELNKGEKNFMYGKKHTDEWKRKVSEKLSGRNSKSNKKVIGPDGTIYYSIREAAEKNPHLSYNAISDRLRGKVKSDTGWSYYED